MYALATERKLANWPISLVFTLIDNYKRLHSGQNVADSRGGAEWVRNILTTGITCIVVDKSKDHAKPHFDLFFIPQYQSQRKCVFFQSASWKTHYVVWTLIENGKISQSDCEIRSNCGKKDVLKRARISKNNLKTKIYLTVLYLELSLVIALICRIGHKIKRPVVGHNLSRTRR